MSTAITSYKEQAERLRSTLMRYREESKESSEAMLFQFEVAGGGAVAALLDHYIPTIPGTDVETKTIAGVGGALLGMSAPFFKLGESARHLSNICAGINAVNTYEEIKEALAKK
jgi:hypothetical protein